MNDYVIVVELITYYHTVEKLSLEERIGKAIKECIKNNILKSYLQKYGVRVRAIFFKEFSHKDDLILAREEARKEISLEITKNMISLNV